MSILESTFERLKSRKHIVSPVIVPVNDDNIGYYPVLYEGLTPIQFSDLRDKVLGNSYVRFAYYNGNTGVIYAVYCYRTKGLNADDYFLKQLAKTAFIQFGKYLEKINPKCEVPDFGYYLPLLDEYSDAFLNIDNRYFTLSKAIEKQFEQDCLIISLNPIHKELWGILSYLVKVSKGIFNDSQLLLRAGVALCNILGLEVGLMCYQYLALYAKEKPKITEVTLLANDALGIDCLKEIAVDNGFDSGDGAVIKFNIFPFNKTTGSIGFDEREYLDYLESLGFRCYKSVDESEKGGNVYCRVVDKIVTVVDVCDIMRIVADSFRNSPKIFLKGLAKHSSKCENESRLHQLLPIYKVGLVQTIDTTYIPYLNGLLRITKDGVKLIDYADVEILIWNKEQIKRNYAGETAHYQKSDFYRYLNNVSRGDDLLKFMCSIGYMVCGYKNPSLTKVIVLTDMAIATSRTDANGGTGKGIFIKALGEIRSVCTVDKYDPESTHTFQKYQSHHSIIAFTDTAPGFDFRSLFNASSESLEVRRMYEGAFDVPYSKSPRFILATNDVIVALDPSTQRRVYTLEFAPYYHKDFSPFDEFGHNLFGEDWGTEQYAHFDYIISMCVNLFLLHGLLTENPVNALTRQLLACTCDDFVDFASEVNESKEKVYLPIQPDSHFLLDELFSTYQTLYSPDKLEKHVFSRWVNNYYKLNGIKIEKLRKNIDGQKKQLYVIKS